MCQTSIDGSGDRERGYLLLKARLDTLSLVIKLVVASVSITQSIGTSTSVYTIIP